MLHTTALTYSWSHNWPDRTPSWRAVPCRQVLPTSCPGLATCARGGTTAAQACHKGQDIAQVLPELGVSMKSWGSTTKNKLYSVTTGVIGHIQIYGTKNSTFFKQKDQEKTLLSVVQAKNLWTRYSLSICLCNLFNKSHITDSREEFMWKHDSFSLFLGSRKEIKLWKAYGNMKDPKSSQAESGKSHLWL